MRRTWIFLIVVATGLALDQVSKVLAFGSIREGQSVPLIQDVLHFTHGKNTGVAFSLFNNHPGVILLLTAVAVVALTVWWWKTRATASSIGLWALALILVGAAGNLVDRVWLGYVRDFIDFRPELPIVGHWAVFNVADMCICVGVGLYLLSEWRSKPAAADDKPVDA
jgi:signal peptidase II